MMNLILEIWGVSLVILFIISALRWPLTFIQLLIFGLIGLALNIIGSLDSIDSFIVIHLFGSMTVFLSTLVIFGIKKSTRRVRDIQVSSRSLRKASVLSALAMSILIVTYHYSVVGVPLFSDDIGVLRFQQAASGLFGVPSRFASYAPSLIFLFVLTMLDGSALRGWLASILIFICAVLLVFQGHKSSLLQLPLLAIISYPALSVLTRQYLVRYAALLAGAGIYLVYEVYTRIGGFGDLAFGAYLVERLSSIGMAPIIAMYSELFKPTALSDLYFFNDAIYPFAKAIGSELETVNTQLSRYIYGVEDGRFSVPVTPGMFAYFYSDFGFFGSLFAVGAMSWISVRIIENACSAKNISNRVFYLWLQYIFYVGFSSGNLFYLLPNALLVFTIFWGFERFFNVIYKSMAKTNSASPVSKEVNTL